MIGAATWVATEFGKKVFGKVLDFGFNALLGVVNSKPENPLNPLFTELTNLGTTLKEVTVSINELNKELREAKFDEKLSEVEKIGSRLEKQLQNLVDITKSQNRSLVSDIISSFLDAMNKDTSLLDLNKLFKGTGLPSSSLIDLFGSYLLSNSPCATSTEFPFRRLAFEVRPHGVGKWRNDGELQNRRRQGLYRTGLVGCPQPDERA